MSTICWDSSRHYCNNSWGLIINDWYMSCENKKKHKNIFLRMSVSVDINNKNLQNENLIM